MKGGKDVQKRNVGNKEKEGLDEDGNKRKWKLGKQREYNRIEQKGREGKGKEGKGDFVEMEVLKRKYKCK